MNEDLEDAMKCRECCSETLQAEISRLQAIVASEHELYLSAHRENMKAAARIMELKAVVAEKERQINNLAEAEAKIAERDEQIAALSKAIKEAMARISVPRPHQTGEWLGGTYQILYDALAALRRREGAK